MSTLYTSPRKRSSFNGITRVSRTSALLLTIHILFRLYFQPFLFIHPSNIFEYLLHELSSFVKFDFIKKDQLGQVVEQTFIKGSRWDGDYVDTLNLCSHLEFVFSLNHQAVHPRITEVKTKT